MGGRGKFSPVLTTADVRFCSCSRPAIEATASSIDSINVGILPWVRETLAVMGKDNSAGMPAVEVGRAFVESVEGLRNGEIIDLRGFA